MVGHVAVASKYERFLPGRLILMHGCISWQVNQKDVVWRKSNVVLSNLSLYCLEYNSTDVEFVLTLFS